MRAVFSYDPGCSEEEWNNFGSISTADGTQTYAVNCRKNAIISIFRKQTLRQQELLSPVAYVSHLHL